MVNIVFCFTDFDPNHGLESPKNYIKEWLQNSKVLGANKIIMIDRTEFKIGKHYKHNDSNILFEYYESLEDLYNTNNNSDSKWVFFEGEKYLTQGNVTSMSSLKNYTHPQDVYYVFGPDFSAIDIYSYNNADWVYIETETDNPLYAMSAASIVLYDRLVKNKA